MMIETITGNMRLMEKSLYSLQKRRGFLHNVCNSFYLDELNFIGPRAWIFLDDLFLEWIRLFRISC